MIDFYRPHHSLKTLNCSICCYTLLYSFVVLESTRYGLLVVQMCSAEAGQMSLEGVPLLLRPGRGKDDLLWGCVRRLVRVVKGSMRELRSVTLTSHSFTFSARAHCCATSCSTWRRSRRSALLPSTITITCSCRHNKQHSWNLFLTTVIYDLYDVINDER